MGLHRSAFAIHWIVDSCTSAAQVLSGGFQKGGCKDVCSRCCGFGHTDLAAAVVAVVVVVAAAEVVVEAANSEHEHEHEHLAEAARQAEGIHPEYTVALDTETEVRC